MSETTTETTAEETAAETSGDNTEATESATETKSTEGEAALGDAGKKALDAMKAKWKEAEKRATERDAAAAALQAKLDGKEAEYQAEQEKRATEKAALDKANQRILRSEVKAAAKGMLADPQDAYKFLDLDSFEVDDDGNVDESAIVKALTDLVAAKPYLAAQGKRFQGGADGGTRNEGIKPSQLTEADVKRLSSEGRHDEIVKAKAEGRLADYLAS